MLAKGRVENVVASKQLARDAAPASHTQEQISGLGFYG